MTTHRIIAVIVGLAIAVSTSAADRREAQSILYRFRSVRPQATDLAIYQLDWVPTLKAAQERAARDGRPILLVVVKNSFGDLSSGHC